MNLRPLANILAANNLGVLGTSMFFNMLPAEAEEAILLRNPLSGTKIDYELKGYFKTEFQLIVRSHSYANGEVLIKKVIDALTLENTQVEDHNFNYSRPRTEAVAFPLSRGNLLEFNVMFDVCFVRS
ncbi:minor capsid protein [Undibacterium sp. 5I1]|uniref:minor capsid protein n=1 Tax=unclassified Undibacterium TaxID=2630295 RepID=UPI002AB3D01C|nr:MULTISPECIES: minor capsid protein [unclassified Undibacterium]MDY7537613.1 minor capsid protein [Undibacterium sp. 5I1]MEB0230158.1 minor capsid protein [Undibacterium sp. 10I3]MEB0256350.1 minor capsid protein [Undibacterium sp. 5I1]